MRRSLTAAALASVDAVVFANTTGNLGVPDLGAFLDWIAAGHGFAGMHSASDTYHDEPRYLAMLGNEFLIHGEQAAVDALVENSDHPAASPLGGRFRVFDEIYKFTRANRGEVTMLLSLDRHPADGLPEAGRSGDLPLAWAKAHGQGRVFYTALGHREDVWENPLYQQHVLGGHPVGAQALTSRPLPGAVAGSRRRGEQEIRRSGDQEENKNPACRGTSISAGGREAGRRHDRTRIDTRAEPAKIRRLVYRSDSGRAVGLRSRPPRRSSWQLRQAS